MGDITQPDFTKKRSLACALSGCKTPSSEDGQGGTILSVKRDSENIFFRFKKFNF